MNLFTLALGLLLTAGLAVAAVVFVRRRSAALAAAGVATRAGRWAHLGLALTIAGLGVLAVAAADPTATVPVPRASGTIILAMDVSNSMGADDVTPTRLAAAQKAARAFIRAQPASVDIGVVAFERGAITTARPDHDHAAALAAIDRLKLSGGTSLGTAIVASLSAISGKPVNIGRDGTAPDLGYWRSGMIVMFSDGQDLGDNADVAAAVAQQAGVRIDTVGIGTTTGAAVTVDGFRLHTALDEDALKSIAQTTGGAYHPATDPGDLDAIASTIEARLTVEDEPLPLAGAFIALALLLLTAGSAHTIFRSGRVI